MTLFVKMFLVNQKEKALFLKEVMDFLQSAFTKTRTTTTGYEQGL